MIEIMIAILIFSVGLLGIASTQTLGLTNTQSALNRSYAAQLSYEIVDIMRVNRVVTNSAGSANIFSNLNTTTSPSPYSETAGCEDAATTCSASDLASHQVAQWSERVQTLLPDGQASLSLAGNTYTLRFTWRDIKNQDEVLGTAINDVAGNARNDIVQFNTSFQL